MRKALKRADARTDIRVFLSTRKSHTHFWTVVILPSTLDILPSTLDPRQKPTLYRIDVGTLWQGLTRNDGWLFGLLSATIISLAALRLFFSVGFFPLLFFFFFCSRGSFTVIADVAVIDRSAWIWNFTNRIANGGLQFLLKVWYISNESNEIEESISQFGLPFTIKPFLLFTKSLSSMKHNLHAHTVITTEIMRTSQETNFRRRK